MFIMRINKTFSLSVENDLFLKALLKELPYFNMSKYLDDILTENRKKWIEENKELAKNYNNFEVNYPKVEKNE